jgi:hypothetical protein
MPCTHSTLKFIRLLPLGQFNLTHTKDATLCPLLDLAGRLAFAQIDGRYRLVSIPSSAGNVCAIDPYFHSMTSALCQLFFFL